VRELRNTVERLLILSSATRCGAEDVDLLVGDGRAAPGWGHRARCGYETFADFKDRAERAFILQKLRENDWNVAETAREVVDMPRSNLYKKIEKYGLAPGGLESPPGRSSRRSSAETPSCSSRRKTCRTRARCSWRSSSRRGSPPEVINLVHGTGEEVGAPLVSNPDVPVISFTGSTETGRTIGETCGRMHKRLSLEMGGKNAQIVMPDADMDLALEGVLWGAFGTTGQRCTATSRLLLHRDIEGSFLAALRERIESLRLGDGLEEGTDVGPLINRAALEKVEGYMEVARAEGEILCGGRRATGGRLDDGYFFEPTIVAGLKPGARLACEEVFGPVLSVLAVRDLDEAIAVNNEVRYGLSSSLYTSDVRAAFRALNELDNGITYVNAPTIGAEAHLPFGGVKETGNGHREGGWEVYEFYSETKVCYVDYSGTLQRAQIDNY
jgi:hypothetical protein